MPFFCWAGCGQSPQPDLPLYHLSANLSSVFCKKNFFLFFPKRLTISGGCGNIIIQGTPVLRKNGSGTFFRKSQKSP